MDGAKVAESRLFFIRPPAAGEPVHHQFHLDTALPAGPHRLQVRDATQPRSASETVTIQVVAPLDADAQPLLRLGSLSDGTLLLVLSGTDAAGLMRIQASADLQTWETVGSGTSAFGVPVPRPVGLAPTVATRFYRAVRLGTAE